MQNRTLLTGRGRGSSLFFVPGEKGRLGVSCAGKCGFLGNKAAPVSGRYLQQPAVRTGCRCARQRQGMRRGLPARLGKGRLYTSFCGRRKSAGSRRKAVCRRPGGTVPGLCLGPALTCKLWRQICPLSRYCVLVWQPSSGRGCRGGYGTAAICPVLHSNASRRHRCFLSAL